MRKNTVASCPENHEIIKALLGKYGPRDVVLFHRAILQNNFTVVKTYLEQSPSLYVNSTLLPDEINSEVSKCTLEDLNSEAIESFPRVTIQTKIYNEYKLKNEEGEC